MNPLQYFEDNIVGHYNAPRRAHIVLSAEYNIYKFKFRKTGRFQMLNDHSEYFNYPAVSFLLIPLGSVNAHYCQTSIIFNPCHCFFFYDKNNYICILLFLIL